MKAALALPVALILGALADLGTGMLRRIVLGERGWWRRVTDRWTDVRRLLRSPRARPAAVEAVGAAVALTGAGFAAGAALGVIPGTLALAYPALAVSAIGAHLGTPIRRGSERPAAGARLQAALAEPAFALAVAAMALRWRAIDLEAVRGTQTVLGPGLGLGPALVAVGLILGAVVALSTGSLRVPPEPPAVARRAGSSLLAALARWAGAGATSMLVAVMVAGHRLDPSAGVVGFAAAAVIAAILLGAGGGAVRMLSARRARMVAGVALVAGAAAVALAVAG